jgi:hypothetical protein
MIRATSSISIRISNRRFDISKITEENAMLKKPLFRLWAAIAIVFAANLSVGKVIARMNILSGSKVTMIARAPDCVSLPSHYSVHSEIIPETGTTLPYTEDGPAGLDGGLIHLLSNYRTCSRE